MSSGADGDVGRTERKWETNVRLIEELCTSLERVGAQNVAASRVGEYKRAFHRLRDPAGMPLDEVPRLLASMADFHELRRILAAVEALESPGEWLAKLRAIPRGVAFSTEPDPRPDGRDPQFECFVAAVMVLGGATVRFDEPDLIVTHRSESIAVAVKRPRSQKKSLSNVRKGIKQVKQSGMRGLVAVDFSTALHHGEYVHADGLHDAASFVRGSANRAVRAVAEEVGALALESGVLGVLGHVMLPVVDADSARALGLATSVRWTLARIQPSENMSDQWLDELEDVCRRGLAHPIRGDEFIGRGLR